MTPTVQRFSALLTLLAALIASAAIAGWILARRGSPRLLGSIQQVGIAMIAAIASAATAGSLYFSEVTGYVPCTLCWYQRILMYPIALVSLTAVLRRETPFAYIGVLAAVGAPISLYHWLLERFPDMDAGVCSATTPCTLVWFEELGFITLPFMALVAFVAMLAICLTSRRRSS